jgi:hypothetical protein
MGRIFLMFASLRLSLVSPEPADLSLRLEVGFPDKPPLCNSMRIGDLLSGRVRSV